LPHKKISPFILHQAFFLIKWSVPIFKMSIIMPGLDKKQSTPTEATPPLEEKPVILDSDTDLDSRYAFRASPVFKRLARQYSSYAELSGRSSTSSPLYFKPVVVRTSPDNTSNTNTPSPQQP
jgi:hypothetical protein